MMKITINDIAEKAGVAKSTVSYALSGSRPISDEVRERIAVVMRELNYRPSHAARVMRSAQTMGIGVAVDQCSNPSSAFFLEELGRLARENGYHILLGISGGIQEEGRKIIDHFSTGIVDGIINCMPEISEIEAAKLSRGLPTVTYCRESQSSPAEPDYLNGMMELMSFLTSLGHRRIGFISIRQRGMNTGGDPCLLGYRMYCESRGITPDPELIISGEDSFEIGQGLGAELYRRGATAIFAGNDRTAAGILAWAHENDIKIPEQLSVAGWDDSPLAAVCSPPLTTVQMPYRELARYTMEALLIRIKGQDTGQKHLVGTRLIIRRSTAQAAS